MSEDPTHGQAIVSAGYSTRVWNFYRTAMGKILRVEESDEGSLTVKVLKDGAWADAPLGMIGLRISATTRRLTASEIDHLPA